MIRIILFIFLIFMKANATELHSYIVKIDNIEVPDVKKMDFYSVQPYENFSFIATLSNNSKIKYIGYIQIEGNHMIFIANDKNVNKDDIEFINNLIKNKQISSLSDIDYEMGLKGLFFVSKKISALNREITYQELLNENFSITWNFVKK